MIYLCSACIRKKAIIVYRLREYYIKENCNYTHIQYTFLLHSAINNIIL